MGEAEQDRNSLVQLIENLLRQLDGTAVTECEFRYGSQEVVLTRKALHVTAAPGVAVPAGEVIPDSWKAVTSPLTGIFYHTETPQSPPFVTEGAVVAQRQVVGLIESMKMYNPVETDFAGVVRSILVPGSAVVERGQILMYIEPDGGGA